MNCATSGSDEGLFRGGEGITGDEGWGGERNAECGICLGVYRLRPFLRGVLLLLVLSLLVWLIVAGVGVWGAVAMGVVGEGGMAEREGDGVTATALLAVFLADDEFGRGEEELLSWTVLSDDNDDDFEWGFVVLLLACLECVDISPFPLE
jgi:hypothetical protein